MRTLSLDIGGTKLKASVLDSKGRMSVPPTSLPTPTPCPPKVLIEALVKLIRPLPSFDRVSVGFPGLVRDGRVLTAPHFGNRVWRNFNLARALQRRLKKPVRLLNDADMQGLAAIRGRGLELVVTLGTGVGTALFRDGELMPHLELAHHPLAAGKTYNQYLGERARRKIGDKAWNLRAQKTARILRALTNYDRLYLGGGNSRRILFHLDKRMRIVNNRAGILGGMHLWKRSNPHRQLRRNT